jgi:hypothetical protein
VLAVLIVATSGNINNRDGFALVAIVVIFGLAPWLPSMLGVRRTVMTPTKLFAAAFIIAVVGSCSYRAATGA